MPSPFGILWQGAGLTPVAPAAAPPSTYQSPDRGLGRRCRSSPNHQPSPPRLPTRTTTWRRVPPKPPAPPPPNHVHPLLTVPLHKPSGFAGNSVDPEAALGQRRLPPSCQSPAEDGNSSPYPLSHPAMEPPDPPVELPDPARRCRHGLSRKRKPWGFR